MKLKFLTLNLFEGGLLFDNIIDFLHQQKADIFVLQEAYNSHDEKLAPNLRSIQLLSKEFKSYYFRFSPMFLDNRAEGKIEFGNVVFSRFPITADKVIFFDIPYDLNFKREDKKKDFTHIPRIMQNLEIKAVKTKINVFNIHGIWGFHGRDTSRRLKMGQTIIEKIKGKKNVIMAGDFNLSPNTRTVGNIQKYLISVFGERLTSTFNMKHKNDPGYAKAAVDMIFVSKNIKVIEKSCPQVDVSDHLPLVCLLEI